MSESETRTGSGTGSMIETSETARGIEGQGMNERTVAFWTTVTEIGRGADRGRESEGVASSLLALVSLRLLVLCPLLLLRRLLLPLLL